MDQRTERLYGMTTTGEIDYASQGFSAHDAANRLPDGVEAATIIQIGADVPMGVVDAQESNPGAIAWQLPEGVVAGYIQSQMHRG